MASGRGGVRGNFRNKANLRGSEFGFNGLRRRFGGASGSVFGCGLGFGFDLGFGGAASGLDALEVAEGGVKVSLSGVDAVLKTGEDLVDQGVDLAPGIL